MSSIRRRLTLGLVLGLGAIFGAGSSALYLHVRCT